CEDSQANNVSIALASSEGLTPESKLATALAIAKGTLLERCIELNMGSHLGVAATSTNPPKFIHLCYKPPSESFKTKLAIVGKGLNFDSSGHNIKTGPGCSIKMMNCDMGGSSAVLGAAKALGQIKPQRIEMRKDELCEWRE
ncbi:leucine aminopeptidase 1-like protein, partial [Tanacetum coccineum]